MSEQYKNAGVDLEAGYESVERIKKHISATHRLGVMGNIGSFGGLFDLSALNYKNPVLVSGTDGVGTKLKLAFMMDKHDTIGQDVVAMCVNDVLAQGAQPLLFLDYIAVGKNHPEKIEAIVKGVSDGCVLANCALVGGETAEMPDMYEEDEYDVAGFTVGVVEKDRIIEEARQKAASEAHLQIEEATRRIREEKEKAIREVRSEIADLSIAIAEKVIKEKINRDNEHKQIIDRLLNEVSFSKS